MHTATNVPVGVGISLGGVVAGVVSVLLFQVCVWGVVKCRRRMYEPAHTEEREGIRFVRLKYIILCSPLHNRIYINSIHTVKGIDFASFCITVYYIYCIPTLLQRPKCDI